MAKSTDTTTNSKNDPVSPPVEDERSVYDQAFQTLLQDPKEAVPEFRSFLKEYPNSSLASSAQYWIGEALYAEKDFKGAVEEFLVVLKEHKSSDKAPDAALKLGYSFYELKEWDKAQNLGGCHHVLPQ
ncbi:MAG: tol-pal system protein YbgF [Candidatus Thiothrix singaporensis]|uniref:Tol-pal system protein YbgF n=1 Tax=Candidatus Thiothrix singaporensis TaxID=2799669 RepID=A0A7L6AYD8_9GAMM|nr:MAG: tol-pal system protein YbgF [Candidatus Thiothrix singaporensis]